MNRLIVFLLIGIILFGCIGPAVSTENRSNISAQANITQQNISKETGVNATGQVNITEKNNETTVSTTAGNKTVLMLGRSVANAWMEYLDAEYVCADEECDEGSYEANYSGYTFVYYEMDTPPAIINSAITGLDTYGSRADIVFFKLCFDDFESDETGENLKRNKGYIESIYNEVVVKRKKRLIVGNALPRVKEYTDSELVSTHRSYNQWLNNFSATHKDIKVFDLYGTLTDPDGSLKSSYSLDQYDSHLNNAAYAQITPKFLKLLD